MADVVVVVVAVVVEVTPPGRKSGPPPLGPRLVHGTKKKKSSKYSKVKDGSQAIRKALQVKFESKTKKKKKNKRGNNRSGRDHMQIARPAAAVVEVGSRLDCQQGHVVPQG